MKEFHHESCCLRVLDSSKKLKLPTCGNIEPTRVQLNDPLMSTTTGNPLPLTKVDAMIPRAQNLERINSDLGFELRQRQPVRLIIPTNNRGD